MYLYTYILDNNLNFSDVNYCRVVFSFLTKEEREVQFGALERTVFKFLNSFRKTAVFEKIIDNKISYSKENKLKSIANYTAENCYE